MDAKDGFIIHSIGFWFWNPHEFVKGPAFGAAKIYGWAPRACEQLAHPFDCRLMTITQNSCGFLSSAMIDHWAFAGGACTFVHSRGQRNCNTGLADYSKVSMAAVPFPIRSGGEVV